MNAFLTRFRNSLTLAIVLFVQLLGLAVQIKHQSDAGQTRLIRYWAVAAISPFEKAVVHTQSWTRSVWNNYVSLRAVREQNETLKQQLEQMRLEQVRLREDANQAHRIQALLAFKEQYISKTVAAQVIGTSGSELSRTIYIDRGSDYGIEPDMPVITPDGIVGKVLRVYGSTSQVLEINDQNSGVGAILVSSRLQGILKGTPSGELNLNYIMADEKIETGDQVVTSGGDRIYPKGLPIGRIASVSLGRDSFLNLRIAPSANLNRLEEVLVITERQLKEPDTKDLGPIRASDILAERLPSVPPKPDPQAAAGQTGSTTPTPPATGVAPSGASSSQPSGTAGSGAPTTTKPAQVKPAPAKPAGTGAQPQASPATKPAASPKPSTTGSPTGPKPSDSKPSTASPNANPSQAKTGQVKTGQVQ
jgi:rod shape-determining protein MreC